MNHKYINWFTPDALLLLVSSITIHISIAKHTVLVFLIAALSRMLMLAINNNVGRKNIKYLRK